MKELDPERWQRLASHLARARAKPTWDVEEREPKLVIAGRVRQALGGTHERDLAARIERLAPAAKKRFALLRTEDFEWLRAWAAEDPGSLAGALGAFAPGERDPVARFDAWARTDRCTRDPGAALAIGSLLNFAVNPRRTPIISHGAPPFMHDEPEPRGEAMFDGLESELGYETGPGDTLTARYRRHLHFADLVEQRLVTEGIEIRDMIDVQSLIFVAVLERDLWAIEPPPDLEVTAEPLPETYLAVCAHYRDEAPYLAEWIEFHRVVGVERFFLYDNRSSDGHLKVLEPYIADGTVVLHDWPGFPVQSELYGHCLGAHSRDARWIAFIDVDEFLFSPELRPLPSLMREYEDHPAVGVNWAAFGTSGHRTRPPGLVIESYLRRGARERSFIGRSIKNIVQPRWTARCVNAHRFEYRHGLAVDENGYPIRGGATKSLSFERLRLNHYYTKSEAELREKLARREQLERSGARGWLTRPQGMERAIDEFDDEHDDLITAYVPQVRAALAGRARARDAVRP